MASGTQQEKLLYTEHQRVPLVWWLFAAGVVAIISWQAQMGRPMWASFVALAVAGSLAVWALIYFSRTKVEVTEDSSGERWLHVGPAKLPAHVVSRSLVIPPTAKRAAMGRQLDPAAYVVHKGWIPQWRCSSSMIRTTPPPTGSFPPRNRKRFWKSSVAQSTKTMKPCKTLQSF